MAYVLFGIGIILVLGGGWSAWQAARMAPAMPSGDLSVMAFLTVTSPGLAAMLIGVFCLAAGEGLVRLASISRSTSDAAYWLRRSGLGEER